MTTAQPPSTMLTLRQAPTRRLAPSLPNDVETLEKESPS